MPPSRFCNAFLTGWLGLTFSAAAVFPPRAPVNPLNEEGFWVGQSEPTPRCLIRELKLTAASTEDSVTINGELAIEAAHGGALPIVLVRLVCTLPTGEALRQQVQTGDDGRARFSFHGPHGAYRVRVESIRRTAFVLDAEESVLMARLTE